ncbi:MAG: ROK family protein [Nitrolancea sp.]
MERTQLVTNVALAVDLGGTNVRAALVDSNGEIRHLVSRPTLGHEGPEAVIDRLAALVGEVVAHENPAQQVEVGVIAPGAIDPDAGIIYFGPNIPDWHDIPLRDMLESRLNRTVHIGNDANCAALGEARFGSGQGTQDMIYIAIGTGVGGGVISNGHLIGGKRGFGGELGHVSVDPTGPRCSCGGIGCVESFVSGWAIVRDAEILVHSLRSDELTRMSRRNPITPEMVAMAAAAGDQGAKSIFDRAGQALAASLGGMINIFNPELLVIGGGISKAGDLLIKPFRKWLPNYALPSILADVTIRESSLGLNTGIYGGAALVFYRRDLDA